MSLPTTAYIGPWCAGKAECFDCGHEWTALWPLGSEALECPSCGSINTDRTEVKEPRP